MKLHQLLVAAILAGFLAFGVILGCSQDAPTRAGIHQGESLEDDFDTQRKKKKAKRKKTPMRIYSSVLRGENEVPPVETEADGRAHVTIRGGEIKYSVSANGLDDIVQAHFHLAPAGANGAVVLFLTLNDQGTSIAKGTATAADFIGPLAGMAMSDLVAKIEDGDIYVNVHTVTNPPGEIRGQLDEVGNQPSRKKKKVKKKT